MFIMNFIDSRENIPKIKLYKGDCLELMKNIPDKSIDLILCDLPYGCGKTYNKWDKSIPVNKLWDEYNRVIKENGIICLFSQEPFTSELILSNKAKYRYKWIWKKESPIGFLNANYKPLGITEEICIFSNYTVGSASKNKIRYNPQGVIEINKKKRNNPNSSWRKNKGYSVGSNILNSNKPFIQKYTNYPVEIISFARDKERYHPTQKPVALLEYLIKTYTTERETVLDNCMGSGSTGVACVNTNRNFIGIELDNTYYDIAKNRILQNKVLYDE